MRHETKQLANGQVQTCELVRQHRRAGNVWDWAGYKRQRGLVREARLHGEGHVDEGKLRMCLLRATT